MSKTWKLLPRAPEEFFYIHTELSPVVTQLLFNRGLRTMSEIEHFFHPELHLKNYDPWLFQNMESAISLTINHIKQGNKIVVCGDYDADGVSASALLSETLRTLKACVEVWIPSRFGEGYGLNNTIISEFKEQDIKLVITVDNGIRAHQEIVYAQTLGIEVIVTDHHTGPPSTDDLPPCLIVNPILSEETYPFRYLCGAGVAYKFAQALIQKSTLSRNDKEKLLINLVDLAAIGTISDCVSLLGENRVIVRRGLEMINRKPRLGIAELMKVANLTPGEITGWNVGWQITPRLNASGRLSHATAAYQLLVTTSVEEAKKLAADLQEKNIARQKITEAMVETAVDLIIKEQGNEKLLIVLSPDLRGEEQTWSEGVIGLVAGRLTERFGRPCFVICSSEGAIKGSGRSIEQYNIGASLEAGKTYLSRYGGHAMACGFTVKDQSCLELFIHAMREEAKHKLKGINLSPTLWIDSELTVDQLTDVFVETLEKFAPYGEDNPEPYFVSYNVIINDIMIMGTDKRHIKFLIGNVWAVAFGRAEEYQDYKIGDRIDLVYTVSFNIFNNRRSVQLRVVDLRSVQQYE